MSRHEAAQAVNRRNPELRPDATSKTLTGIPATSHYSGTSALTEFNAAIAAEQARRPGLSRAAAAMTVNRKNPTLAHRVVDEANRR